MSSKKALQVVFILDITNSMSDQLDGVKQMVASFCTVERPAIDTHIWTYTEISNCCYVSKSPRGLTSSQLVEYVRGISLCSPPDSPHIRHAHGGDDPENVTAAVVSLMHEFDATDYVVCFVITDNAPHHRAYRASTEAKAERAWLTAHGHDDHDVFRLLNQTIETLNVTLIRSKIPTLRSITMPHFNESKEAKPFAYALLSSAEEAKKVEEIPFVITATQKLPVMLIPL